MVPVISILLLLLSYPSLSCSLGHFSAWVGGQQHGPQLTKALVELSPSAGSSCLEIQMILAGFSAQTFLME